MKIIVLIYILGIIILKLCESANVLDNASSSLLDDDHYKYRIDEKQTILYSPAFDLLNRENIPSPLHNFLNFSSGNTFGDVQITTQSTNETTTKDNLLHSIRATFTIRLKACDRFLRCHFVDIDLTPSRSEWLAPTYKETIFKSNDFIDITVNNHDHANDSQLSTHSHLFNVPNVTLNSQPKSNLLTTDCFYQGSLLGYPKSWAILDDCELSNQFSGYLFDGYQQFYIEPSVNNNSVTNPYNNKFENNINSPSSAQHKMWPVEEAVKFYSQKRDISTINRVCDIPNQNNQQLLSKHYSDGHNIANSINFPDPDLNSSQITNNYKIRKKRDLILPEYQGHSPLVIELYVVNDYAQFVKWGKDERKVILRTLQISHILNAIFKQLNILVALVGTEVWTSGDRIKMSTDGDATLKAFNKYRQTSILKAVPHDNAQLLTAKYFDGGVIGKAIKRQICAYSDSTGVAMDHNMLVGPVASTMAHELGHSLGMDHDTEICECADKVCVMTPASGAFLALKWSSCSLQYLSYSIARGMDTCLQNLPAKVLDTPTCGNMFLEPGEECDCGPAQYCQNKCCNAATCKLSVNSTCATGSCCNFFTCQLRPRASICRPAVGACDLPEYCNGKSEFCPTDFKVQDGTPCPSRSQYAKIYGGEAGEAAASLKKYIVNSATSNNANTRRGSQNSAVQDSGGGFSNLVNPKDQRLAYGPEDDLDSNYSSDNIPIHINTDGSKAGGNKPIKGKNPLLPKQPATRAPPDHNQAKILGAIDENYGKYKLIYGKGHCFSGYCNSYSAQCRLLWGPTGKMSVPMCYKQNTFTPPSAAKTLQSSNERQQRHSNGDCGYDIQTDSYKSCPIEDSMCGRLHCVNDADRLAYGETSGRKEWHSYIRYNSVDSDNRASRGLRYWSCHAAFIDLGDQVPDIGMVPNGATCDIDKICVNRSCVHKSAITGVRKCPKGCSGHGICNSNNRCHCFFGYGPPYCDKPGPGGSLDSGPPADIRKMKPLIKALLIVFLCLIPSLCIVTFCIYKCMCTSRRAKKYGSSGSGTGDNIFGKFIRDILYLSNTGFKNSSNKQRHLKDPKRNNSTRKKYSATNYTANILGPAGGLQGNVNGSQGLRIEHPNDAFTQISPNIRDDLIVSAKDKIIMIKGLDEWPLSDRPTNNKIVDNHVDLKHQPTRPAPPAPSMNNNRLALNNTFDVLNRSDIFIPKLKNLNKPNINATSDASPKPNKTIKNLGAKTKTSKKVKRVESLSAKNRPAEQPPEPPTVLNQLIPLPNRNLLKVTTPLYQNVLPPQFNSIPFKGEGINPLPLPPRKFGGQNLHVLPNQTINSHDIVINSPHINSFTQENPSLSIAQVVTRNGSSVSQLAKRFENRII